MKGSLGTIAWPWWGNWNFLGGRKRELPWKPNPVIRKTSLSLLDRCFVKAHDSDRLQALKDYLKSLPIDVPGFHMILFNSWTAFYSFGPWFPLRAKKKGSLWLYFECSEKNSITEVTRSSSSDDPNPMRKKLLSGEHKKRSKVKEELWSVLGFFFCARRLLFYFM